ncbi:hypothetical protein F5888DRAFT_1910854 [Russula emetica]|nr:hypothetical protein F5888DRAFT_1910854 [Russula emetica]
MRINFKDTGASWSAAASGFPAPPASTITSTLVCHLYVSCSVIYEPMTCIVAHWREDGQRPWELCPLRRLSVFPVAFHNLNATVGFKWSMRIISFVLMLIPGVTNLTLRRRLPPIVVAGGLFNPEQFKSPAYSVYTASVFVAGFGLYTVLTFIDASAPSQSVSHHLSSYPVAIADAGSAAYPAASSPPGLCVHPADTLLHSTFPSPFTYPHCTSHQLPTSSEKNHLKKLWPHLRGTGALLHGASLDGRCASHRRVSRRTLPLLARGPAISGAIYHATGGYSVVGIYAGFTMTVSVVLLTLSRYFVLRRWRGKYRRTPWTLVTVAPLSSFISLIIAQRVVHEHVYC